MDLFNLVESNNFLQLKESISDINIKNRNEETLVHVACIHGHIECLRILIDAGGDITIKNRNGETPAHISCKHGNIECLRILLEAGADFNSQDCWGWTCLITACNYDKRECFKELLKRGADTSIIDQDGGTALHNMCVDSRQYWPDYLNCIRIYIENCSDLDHLNRDGMTALMLAQKLGYKDIVNLFEEYQFPVKGACD